PPAVDASDPRVLRASVGGVRFPAWGRKAHWVASGRRSDRVGGRDATTVFYDGDDGTRLGYTIVSGAALAWPHGARVAVHDGVAVRLLRDHGRRIAAWRVAGHTCVISAPASVPESRLVELASGATYGPA
ncbi:MAG TPA: hypothetical protein VHB30_06160, partial [Solirubrobacteraceae bacterium]|nr:hypothetical protein [Solirubrobacteraceae bacterium]